MDFHLMHAPTLGTYITIPSLQLEKPRYTEGKCPVDGHVLVTNGT